MNKKSIATIAIIIIITLGVCASSYAWFTGKAALQTNVFKAGTVGVVSSIINPDSLNLKIGNMECYNSESFVYTVNNMKDVNTPSSLDLNFQNIVEGNDDTSKGYDSLLEVAKFDIAVAGTESTKLADGKDLINLAANDINYNDLVTKLNTPIKLIGGANNSATYTITAKLPENLTTDGIYDNEYQGKEGSIKITATAKQINGKTDSTQPVVPKDPAEPIVSGNATQPVTLSGIELHVKNPLYAEVKILKDISYYKNSSGLKVIKIDELLKPIYEINLKNIVFTQKESNSNQYSLACTGDWDKKEFSVTTNEVEKSFIFRDVNIVGNYISGSKVDATTDDGKQFLSWLAN